MSTYIHSFKISVAIGRQTQMDIPISSFNHCFTAKRWRKTFEIGGGGGGEQRFVCVRKHTNARGGLGVCSPRKILQIRCSEIASEATFGPNRHYM